MPEENREYTVILFFKDGTQSPTYLMSAETLDQMLKDFNLWLTNKALSVGNYEVEVNPNLNTYRKAKIQPDWREVRLIG